MVTHRSVNHKPDQLLTLSKQEAIDIYHMLDNFMEWETNRYTDNVTCTGTWEDLKKHLNPDAYALTEKLFKYAYS